jgi:hypothetical protein
MNKVAILGMAGLVLIGLFLIGGAAFVVVRAWLKGTK